MNAMVIREFGPPEVMRMEELDAPVPGPGEVTVRVYAVAERSGTGKVILQP